MRETKVGALVFLAMVLLGSMVFLTGGTFFSKKGYVLHVRFSDARGLVPGAPVFVSGVERGTIQTLTVEPDGVRASMFLAPEIRIPEDSVLTIATSGLLGNPSIKITRGTSSVMLSPDHTVAGELPPSFESMLAEVRGDFAEFRKTFQYVNNILGDANHQKSLHETIANLPGLVQDGRSAFQSIAQTSEEAQDMVQHVRSEIQGISQRIEKLVAHTDALVQENREPLRLALIHLESLLEHHDAILKEFDMDGLSGKDLRKAVVKVGDAAAAVEVLVRTAEQQLFAPSSGDSLPATIAQARQAITKAQKVMTDLESFEIEGQVGVHSTLSGHQPEENRGMVDARFWIGHKSTSWGLALGVEDVGEEEGFSIAPGVRFAWGRLWAGIVRGHAGGGLLWRPGPRFPLSLRGQWWDEAGGTWSAEAQVDLSPSVGIFFKHLERDEEPRQSLGISYRF